MTNLSDFSSYHHIYESVVRYHYSIPCNIQFNSINKFKLWGSCSVEMLTTDTEWRVLLLLNVCFCTEKTLFNFNRQVLSGGTWIKGSKATTIAIVACSIPVVRCSSGKCKFICTDKKTEWGTIRTKLSKKIVIHEIVSCLNQTMSPSYAQIRLSFGRNYC